MMQFDRKRFLARYGYFDIHIEESGYDWKVLAEIYNAHLESKTELGEALKAVEDKLRGITPSPHSIRGRVKEPEHVVEKIIRKARDGATKYRGLTAETYANVLTDLVGVRVLYLRQRDWLPIDRHIRQVNEWDFFECQDSFPTAKYRVGDPDPIVQDYKRWGLLHEEQDRGYRSIHYLTRARRDAESPWVEIQLRTLIEEAWSEIDHALNYPRVVNSKAAAEYLLIFNRIAGVADEMGSYVSRFWNDLDRESKSTATFDTSDIARLASLLTEDDDIAELRDFVEATARENASAEYRRWRKKRIANEKLLRAENNLAERLCCYYGEHDREYHSYRITLGKKLIKTPIFTKDSLVGLRLSKDQIKILWTETPQGIKLTPMRPWKCPKPIRNAMRQLGRNVLHHLIDCGGNVWNDPIYRVKFVDKKSEALELELSIDEFFAYRFTSGLLEDELIDLETHVRAGRILAESDFPLRSSILAKGKLGEFENRVCPIGIAAMCAFAVDDGFVIPIHRRSPQVADNSERLSLVPKAIHQPSVGVQKEEASPHWSVLKEIYEEIFSGKPAERFPEVRKHDWFLDRSKQVKQIHEDKVNCGVLATGFAIDALKGSCHISYLVYVEDTEYWKKYSAVAPMWEQKGGFHWIDSRDANQIAQYVDSPDWTSDGLFSFVEGILLLKEKFPEKVNLPAGLNRTLAS